MAKLSSRVCILSRIVSAFDNYYSYFDQVYLGGGNSFARDFRGGIYLDSYLIENPQFKILKQNKAIGDIILEDNGYPSNKIMDDFEIFPTLFQSYFGPKRIENSMKRLRRIFF